MSLLRTLASVRRDVFAGAAYVVIAAAFLVSAMDYSLGTPARLGPGFFPVVLALCLMLVGLVVLFGAFQPARDTSSSGVDFRKCLIVLGSVCVFAMLFEPAGLVCAVFALVFIAGTADSEFSWRRSTALAVFLVCFCLVVFVHLLGLDLPVLPSGL